MTSMALGHESTEGPRSTGAADPTSTADTTAAAHPTAPADPDRHRVGRRYRIVRNAAAGSKGGIPTNACTPEELCSLAERHGLGQDIAEPGSEDEARADF